MQMSIFQIIGLCFIKAHYWAKYYMRNRESSNEGMGGAVGSGVREAISHPLALTQQFPFSGSASVLGEGHPEGLSKVSGGPPSLEPGSGISLSKP